MKKSTALVLAIVVVPLAAWICRLMIVSMATPSADANLIAYSLLVQASRANDIVSARNLAAQSGSLATDRDFCSAASGLSSICEICLKMGVTTKAEGNDLGGMIKSFMYGLLNPVSGVVDGIRGLITAYRLEQQSTKLDSIYLPQLTLLEEKSDGAKSTGKAVSLLVLVGGWVGVAIMANKSAAPRFHRTAEPVMVEVEPVIVVCGECGAKNRQKAHRAGQTLICGNCKMELAS